MILAVPEYSAPPASPAQWDRYYDTGLDKVYIQTLPTTDVLYPNWQEIEAGASIRESMRHEITLTKSRYSAKDYQTFLDEVIAYVKERWGTSFNDFLSSDAAMMIAEYICASLDSMSWYLDREVDDHYMQLARVASNVARLARYLGYKPQPSVAASTDETITLTEGPYSFDVPLHIHHQFQGPNGQIYELGSEQIIPAGDTSKIVGIYQGQTYTEVFTSDGNPNQTFNLSRVPSDEFLARDKTTVTVDLVEWGEEDFLPYGSEEAYELYYLTNPPQLRFGDGVIGKIPPEGSEIRVQYTATKGKAAGLAISGSINQSLTPIVVNYQKIPVSVTNADPARGGSDSESVDSIKANAPRFFLTADRLVTKGDYNALASVFSSSSGAIAKANAIIVRGVADDLELQSLLTEILTDKTQLETYIDQITSDQFSIDAITGLASASGTIRNSTSQIVSANAEISNQTALIDGSVSSVQGYHTAAKAQTDLAKTQLEFLPYQEVIGYGDGTTMLFSKTLAMKPIKPGSFSFVVGSQTVEKSATDGDCDTTPGRLSATMTSSFTSADVGKLIRIGGQLRQIQKYLGSTQIEYSGSRIYGTSLIIEVFARSTSGYSDSAGNIVATGIVGSVNWTSGSVSLSFTTTPPEGVSGKYGVPILAMYQYINESIQDVLDIADAEIDSADTEAALFSGYGTAIDSQVSTSDGLASAIDTLCDDIEALTLNSRTQASLARSIPAQIQNDLDALEEYLDEVISSPCKANIVRISCLTLDENGFYTAPTRALKTDLKTYLDERKIVTVQNSVVGGEYYLVKAKLAIELEIEDLFVFQTVRDQVLLAVNEMFKGRDYGEALKRSEYYNVVTDVDGVKSHNTEITEVAYDDALNTGTPPSVDEDGNLYVGQYEVITKWDVTITQME